MRIPLRWRAWHGDEPLPLEFPVDYDVAMYPPRDAPDIGADNIRQAFAVPIGSPCIAEIVKGRQSAIIVVDDIVRPTPAARVIPAIITELHEGGIPDSGIKFLMALGCPAHDALGDDSQVGRGCRPHVPGAQPHTV